MKYYESLFRFFCVVFINMIRKITYYLQPTLLINRITFIILAVHIFFLLMFLLMFYTLHHFALVIFFNYRRKKNQFHFTLETKRKRKKSKKYVIVKSNCRKIFNHPIHIFRYNISVVNLFQWVFFYTLISFLEEF